MFDFLMNDERAAFKDEVADFVAGIDRQLLLDMDDNKITFPVETVKSLGKQNLLGIRFPKKYGGRGLDWRSEILLLDEMCLTGMTLGCLCSLPSVVGEAINNFGTEEQKMKFLKPTLSGELICAEALTEPRGGSDFFGSTSTARREGDHYILNGAKRFIVGAEGADYFLVYAKTDTDNPDTRKSMSAFLVSRGPGVIVKHVFGLMGARGGGTGRLLFDNVKVPKENLVGEENNAFDIFYHMMVPERMSSAAFAIGIARAALDVAVKYSTKRKAFGKKIKDFQAVSFKVADSITKLDAMRSFLHTTALAIDSGIDASRQRRLVSEAKMFTTKASWEIVNDSMQIMGGIGYTNVYPVERLLRDSRLSLIWTGSNEVMSLIIQSEYYKEYKNKHSTVLRDVEMDAAEAMGDEKVYE